MILLLCDVCFYFFFLVTVLLDSVHLIAVLIFLIFEFIFGELHFWLLTVFLIFCVLQY